MENGENNWVILRITGENVRQAVTIVLHVRSVNSLTPVILTIITATTLSRIPSSDFLSALFTPVFPLIFSMAFLHLDIREQTTSHIIFSFSSSANRNASLPEILAGSITNNKDGWWQAF